MSPLNEEVSSPWLQAFLTVQYCTVTTSTTFGLRDLKIVAVVGRWLLFKGNLML